MVVGVWFEIARVLIFLQGYTWMGQRWKLAQLQTAPRSTNALNTLLLQRHISFEPIAVETMGVYGESTGAILREIGRRLVEATGEPREANWFRQNLAIAIQRGNAFSILSAGRERFYRVGGVEVHPTPHFVPEGVSSLWEILFSLFLILKFFNVLIFCE